VSTLTVVPSGAGGRADAGDRRPAGDPEAPSAAGTPRRGHDWRRAHERLSGRPRSELTAAELDELAEALFWLDRPAESVDVRRQAYATHVAEGSLAGAARAAWQLFYDHFLVGDTAVAGGWLERARHHAGQAASVVEAGFVAVADADRAAAGGDLDAAVDHGQRALDAGRAAGSPDLMAMALQAQGRMLVAVGRSDEGMAMLDEAMLAAVNGELGPLFTGWVYCNVLSTCHDLADLRRAGEWNDAAMRWCDQLRDGAFYPGICRLHVVELACLRGAWQTAEAEARRACGELTAHDPRFAGEAYYLAGEMRRLVGDLGGAQEAFTQAHQLGRLPQPGLARVRLAQGRPEAAAKALRRALDPGPSSPRSRAQLLAARVEAELGVDDREAARAAAGELASIGSSVGGPFLAAMAAAAEGEILLAEGDVEAALARSSDAMSVFRQLELPYEAALAQVCLGLAARGAGDDDSVALELRAALATFEHLGAGPDAERVRALLAPVPASAADGEAATATLTPRELEVLRRVATGETNRQIAAALFVSEHTVARHVSNTLSKLGVGSRAGATAYAFRHGLV
jgi:DNA-binding CsgD family transcriptional regulator/tetratricopeptide (TPR) repeat protein